MIPNKRRAVFLPLLGLFLTTCACVWLLIGGPVGAQGAVQVTIQGLIDAAPEGGTVVIPAGHFTESLTVTKHITLIGGGMFTTVIHATPSFRVITLMGAKTLRLQNLSLEDADITSEVDSVGGAVKLGSGRLEAVGCRFHSNSASYGGAVFQENSDGSVWIADSVIDGNAAVYNGGGVFVRGNSTVSNTSMYLNTAGQHGGAVHSDAPVITLTNSLLQLNQAGLNGGGLNASNSVVIDGGVIMSNTSGALGGGVSQWNGPAGYSVRVTGALFRGNTASQSGGGLWVAHGAATILTNTDFYTNTAAYYGGGVGVELGILEITGGTLSGNVVANNSTTDVRGGGIYLSGVLTVTGASIRHNRADYGVAHSGNGGGVYASLTQPGSITDTRFEDNQSWNGGALYGSGAALLLERDTFHGNGSLASPFTGYGGAIRSSNNPLVMRACTLTANIAMNGGGALDTSGVADISDSVFQGNNVAAASGGAIASHGMLRIDRSRFISNSTSSGFTGGGAVFSSGRLHISNTLLAGNMTSQGHGRAVMLEPSNVLSTYQNSLVNCTIAASTELTGSAVWLVTGTLKATNLIAANHEIMFAVENSSLILDHYLYHGGDLYYTLGSTVITNYGMMTDPLFINPAGLDYHLNPNSPARDAGMAVALTADLDGRRRPIGGGYDLGAYEIPLYVFEPLVLGD